MCVESVNLRQKGEHSMTKTLFISIIVALCVCVAGVALATSSVNHTVTVTVSAVNEVAIAGGNVTLTINSATAGSDLDDATDSTTCDLLWTTNEASKKMTVATDLAAPDFTLKVVAQNVSGGTAASEVTLGTTAADFVTGLTAGSCDLAYTASATAAQGTGSDVHTVTYTITAA